MALKEQKCNRLRGCKPETHARYKEALHLYATTTESIKSLARRFGFNDCAFGQFIRRQFSEIHEQHKELVRLRSFVKKI